MGNKLVIILVIIFGVLAIAQLVRVSELTAKATKRKEEEIPENENKFNGNMMIIFMIELYASFIWLMLKYGYVDLGPAASAHGQEIDWLFDLNWIIIITVFFLPIHCCLFLPTNTKEKKV